MWSRILKEKTAWPPAVWAENPVPSPPAPAPAPAEQAPPPLAEPPGPGPEEILAAAREEAEALVRRAREEASRLREAAVAEGLAAGRVRAEEEAAALRRAAEEQAEALYAEAWAHVQALVPLLARLTWVLAGRVVHGELRTRPDLLAGLLRTAVESLGTEGPRRARVSPKDRERLAEVASTLNVTLVADPYLAEGELVVEGPSGKVDARASRQLGQLRAWLERLLREAL